MITQFKVHDQNAMAVCKTVLQQFSSLKSRHVLLGALQCTVKSCRPRYGRLCSQKLYLSAHLFASRGLAQAPAEAASGQMLSPAVRYLVDTHNITDTSAILGSGPKSRLLKG